MGGSGGQMLSNRSMPVLESAGSFEQFAAYREEIRVESLTASRLP